MSYQEKIKKLAKKYFESKNDEDKQELLDEITKNPKFIKDIIETVGEIDAPLVIKEIRDRMDSELEKNQVEISAQNSENFLPWLYQTRERILCQKRLKIKYSSSLTDKEKKILDTFFDIGEDFLPFILKLILRFIESLGIKPAETTKSVLAKLYKKLKLLWETEIEQEPKEKASEEKESK